MDDDSFKLFLLQALSDTTIAEKLQEIFRPVFTSIVEYQTTKTIQALKDEIKIRDDIIAGQQKEISSLHDKCDDMEQWTRRGSMRVQGLREDGPGTLEDKLLKLFNEDLSIEPPVDLEEIEVTHRLPRGKMAAVQEPRSSQAADNRSAASDGNASNRDKNRPQSVIIKFLSRRTKTRVMDKDIKKNLKDLNKPDYPFPVFFQDDLTARRAKLAYEARQLKRSGVICDTWISNCKIIVKDNHGRIHAITSPNELTKVK